MLKFLIVIFIFSLPYNNFPYGIGGTLTPLALLPLTAILLLLFLKFLKQGYLTFNRYVFFISLIFLIFILITIFNDLFFFEYFISKKNISPFYRTLQFIIYVFISVGSFIIGYKSIKYFRNIDKILKLLLLAFLPSVLFGVLEIILNNNHILNSIRSFLANTKFPDGYYRLYLLTTEPSWAAFDITSFFLPISLYLYYRKKNIFYLLLVILLLVLLLFIKSLLGILTFVLSFIIIIVIFFRRMFFKPKYVFIIPIFIVVFISSLIVFKDIYIERFSKFISGQDSSGLTRSISYIVAIETFKTYPFFGVGFRNTGYLYGDVVYSKYPELTNIYLISDWADFFSKRFPDVKSTLFEILASTGIFGLITILIFLLILFKKLTKLKKIYIKFLFSYIFVATFLGSFSINLIGYPIFWFFVGLFLNIEKFLYRKV